jgi:hypothetical protein
MSTEEVTALEEMLGLGLKPTTSANLGYASTQNDKPEGLKIEESDNIPCDATEQK